MESRWALWVAWHLCSCPLPPSVCWEPKGAARRPLCVPWSCLGLRLHLQSLAALSLSPVPICNTNPLPAPGTDWVVWGSQAPSSPCPSDTHQPPKLEPWPHGHTQQPGLPRSPGSLYCSAPQPSLGWLQPWIILPNHCLLSQAGVPTHTVSPDKLVALSMAWGGASRPGSILGQVAHHQASVKKPGVRPRVLGEQPQPKTPGAQAIPCSLGPAPKSPS